MLKSISSLQARVRNHPLLKNRPVLMTTMALREMVTRDANHMAAGVAYYVLFALFPFVLSVWVISDLFDGAEVLQKSFLEFLLGNLPGSAEFIKLNINQIITPQRELLTLAVVGLVWSSGSIYGAITRVVNRAWGIYHVQPFLIYRLRHLLGLVAFSVLFFSWMIVSYTLQILQESSWPGPDSLMQSGLIKLALPATSWLVTLLIFLMIYRYAPNCRVYWRHVWLGALVSTVLLEVGKAVFTWYLLNYANYDQVYGHIASVIVFVFWVYLAALILTLGAEICSLHQLLYYPDDVDEKTPVWDR